MTQHSNASLASFTVGGRSYPEVTKPNCRVCQSTSRLAIERGLVNGRPPSAIIRDLPDGHGLSARNLSDHLRRGHLSILSEAVLGCQESHAELKGAVVEDGRAAVDRAIRLASVIVGDVLQRVGGGDLQPGIDDGLKAASLLSRLQNERPTVTAASWQVVVARVLDVFESILDPAAFQGALTALRNDEELLALDAKLNQDGSPPTPLPLATSP